MQFLQTHDQTELIYRHMTRENWFEDNQRKLIYTHKWPEKTDLKTQPKRNDLLEEKWFSDTWPEETNIQTERSDQNNIFKDWSADTWPKRTDLLTHNKNNYDQRELTYWHTDQRELINWYITSKLWSKRIYLQTYWPKRPDLLTHNKHMYD